MSRAALWVVALVAGCGPSDPCPGDRGTCLALELRGAIGALDGVQVDLSGDVNRMFKLPFDRTVPSLPVMVRVLVPTGDKGRATAGVTALLGGQLVGAGKATATLVEGRHTNVVVQMVRSTSATCSDGYWNGDETDLDCGGSCGACALGGACDDSSDCASALCNRLRCAVIDAQSSTVTVDRSQVVADDQDTATVTVTVLDDAGNPIPDQMVMLAADGSGNRWVQPMLTDAAGAAQGKLASTVAEAKTVIATLGALTLGAPVGVTFVAGAPARLAFATQPSDGVAGTILAPVSVQVEDGYGNLTITATAAVTVAVGTNPGGGTLGGTISATPANGVAAFADLSVDKAGTGYTLTAVADGLAGATSRVFNVASGVVSASASLVTVAPMSGVVADGAGTATITVTVRDANGNPVSSQTVTLAASGGGNTLTQPTASDAGGKAVGTLKSTVAGPKAITAAAGSLALQQQATVTFVAGMPTQLAFDAQPLNTTGGAPFTPAVAVSIRDVYGNLTGATSQVTLAIQSNPNGGALSGTKNKNAVAGVAGFTDVSINKPGSGYTLRASAASLADAISDTFDIAIGPPALFTFVTQPMPVAAGNPIKPPVQVRVTDLGGNTVESTPTVTMAVNPTNAGLSGTPSAVVSAGIASFDNLRVGQAGTNYTLIAKITGATDGVSAPFTVTAFPWMPARTGLPPGALFKTVIDPVTPATAYLATTGGVYKTTDGGASWSTVNTGLDRLYVATLAIDPNAPQTLYAGTDGGGVYKTTNGGTSWSAINTGFAADATRFFALAIDPTTPTTVYAGDNNGGRIYKTTNGGGSWSAVKTGIASPWSIVIDPATPATIYAATCGEGVYKTVNDGGTWDPMNSGLNNLCATDVAIHPGTPQILYVTISGGGVYRTENGGASWSPVNTGIPGGAATTVNTLVIHPSPTPAPETVYAGTMFDAGVYKTTNAGANWSAVNTGLDYTNVRGLTMDPTAPGTLYAAEDGHLYKTTNGGASWVERSTGITNLGVRALAIDASVPGTVYACADPGAVFKSTDGGGSWLARSNGFSGRSCRYLAFDPGAPSTLFALDYQFGIATSTNGGTSWSHVNDGLNTNNVIALAFQPMPPAAMYAGTEGSGVVKRDLLPSPSPWTATGLPGFVGAIAVHPTNNTVYAAKSGGGIEKSVNGGTMWNPVNNGLPVGAYIQALAMDPSAPDTLYTGPFYVSGASLPFEIYKTTNGGASWESRLSGLTPVWAIVLDPTAPGTVYVTTSSGIYKSTDGGMTWAQASSGLLDGFVHSLAVDPTTPTIVYAGTNGAGVFKTLTGGQ